MDPHREISSKLDERRRSEVTLQLATPLHKVSGSAAALQSDEHGHEISGTWQLTFWQRQLVDQKRGRNALPARAPIAHQIARPDVVASYLARPESSYLSPKDRLAWQTSHYVRKTAKLGPKLAFLRKLVKAMADADVELVVGTDAPTIPGILPGFSVHDALSELEASGLTRFQALSAATRAPGTFIHRTRGGDPSGVIAPGYRADLILSGKNPLATLSTLRKPLGVMVKGQWRDAAALDALTDPIRESYRRASE